jgi:hypothetical protein
MAATLHASGQAVDLRHLFLSTLSAELYIKRRWEVYRLIGQMRMHCDISLGALPLRVCLDLISCISKPIVLRFVYFEAVRVDYLL